MEVSPHGPVQIAFGVEVAAIVALTMSAMALRFPGLGTIPPGIWVDEAVEGLQAGAFLTGGKLPDLSASNVVYPRWPVWWLLECGAVKLGGMTAVAIRAPAAIIGTLTVPLAWLAVRSLWGPLAGLTSAVFIAFSFWHIQLSRMALSPVLLVPEILLVGWLILGRPVKRPGLAGIFSGILCAMACLDYPASFALVIWAGSAALLRVVLPGGEGREGRRGGLWVMGGLGIGAAVYLLLLNLSIPARLGRVGNVGFAPIMDFLAQALAVAINHFSPAPLARSVWDGFPPGAPRFSPVENFAWLAGLAGVLTLPGIPLGRRLALAFWLPIALLPEALPGTRGGLQLIRGVASLATVAMLAGIGSRAWGAAAGRASLGVLAVVSIVSAWHSAGLTYGTYAHSDLSHRMYVGVASDVAGRIRSLSESGSVSVFPPLSYESNPQITFHLWDEIRSGRVRNAGNPPVEDRSIGVYRDPVGSQPIVALVVSNKFKSDRIVGLYDVQGFLQVGQGLAGRGSLREAERIYSTVARLVPDYWEVHAALGLICLKEGKKAEAKRHLLAAEAISALPADVKAVLRRL